MKTYLKKNLFHLSVIITGITCALTGIFYVLYKSHIFKTASSNLLEGSSTLNSYVVSSSMDVNYVNYFFIMTIIMIIFYLIITFVFYKIIKDKRLFNFISFSNIILIIGLIFSCIFINYFILMVFIIIYLIYLYKNLKNIFNLDTKQSIKCISVIIILIIIIYIILKLFV